MNLKILLYFLLNLVILLFGCIQPARLPATTVKTNSSSISNSADSINNKYLKQNEMLTNGIDFTASGNEPFWRLEITEENFGFTSLSEGFETFNAPHTEPIRAMDANVKMYRSVPELREMKIQIVQASCTDDMSGKENKYQVTVELKRGIDKDFKTFKGCGNYITDYSLHDIWMLEEMNGQPINVQQYGKDHPRIEINSSQNTFMGITGSHDISGKLFFEKGLLRFTDIEAPLNLNDKEKDFIKNLQSATGYKLENNRLLLFNPSGELLKFRKTD